MGLGASLEEKQQRMRERRGSPQADPAPLPYFEQHFAPSQIAEMWSVSVDLVRKLFEREPGVLVFGENSGGHGKRRYTTLRIPQSVAERVHRRLTRV